MKHLTDIEAYRSLVMLKGNLPFKTGYMRHSGTHLYYIGESETSMGVDESEVPYAMDVLELYRSRNDDFMVRSALDIYENLNYTLTGGNPLSNERYTFMLQKVLKSAKPNLEREQKKILYSDKVTFKGDLFEDIF
jgi:hypothetical protein